MATLIAANYQSTTITSYGGMWISCGTLKANTLYTLKCRYKYTKNTSSMPQILCYNSNWSYTGGIYDATDDGVMKTRIVTFTSYPSAINYEIGCYAWSYDNQNNGVGGKTGVLEVDWYELWEGDATTFSLTDAIALSENKTANNFLTIQNGCTNPGYFSTAELKNALRSWMGYYYKTHSTTSYGDWVYTYNHYSSASRSRTVTTYDHYSNGKVVQVGRITQTEDATVTYANWSYNWVTTGNSSRSRTVTYTWSDYAPQFTQTETNGGTRYLVLSEETYDGAGGKIVYSFPANGAGSKSLTVYAHDYWGSTCISTSTKISDVSVTCTGFTPTVSGSTITITASNLGTTPTNYKRSTITISKSGFQTRSGYTSVEQEANSWYDKALQITASPNPIAAGGGTSTVTAKVKRGYTSGSESGWDYTVTATLSGSATGFSISGSTITATNNTTANERSISVTGKYGSLTSSVLTVKQNAGTRTYQIVLDPTSITWAASGGSASVAVKYNTLWNGIKTAGPTTLTGYTVSPSSCTASGTSGTTTITVGQNTSSSQKYPQATFSKDGYTPATLTGTQNKPVTSTETVYRVSSVSPSSTLIGNSSGIGSISVYMDKATRTHYKDTSSGSAFKTTTGTWSRVTGKEAAATNISFYIYFQSVNDSSVDWISSGTPTLNLTNGTSTGAAMWYANYANDANTNSTSRQAKMLIVHSTADDVQGAGKNYCIITQSAGQARIPIQIWGRNENRTDIYVSFIGMKVYVYQSSNTSETHVENVEFGGCIPAGYATERRQLAYNTWYVDRLTHPTITQVTVDFESVSIDNTLDSSRYRNCEVWAEVCEGDISMEGYGVSGRYKSNNTVFLDISQYVSWYGRSHTFTFGGFYNGSYSTGAPLNDNSVVVLFFRFYDY